MRPKPVIALIDDASRRRAILKLALHNYMSKDVMSYHHWDFACDVAISHVEQLEGKIAGREHERSLDVPVNQRTVYERVP